MLTFPRKKTLQASTRRVEIKSYLRTNNRMLKLPQNLLWKFFATTPLQESRLKLPANSIQLLTAKMEELNLKFWRRTPWTRGTKWISIFRESVRSRVTNHRKKFQKIIKSRKIGKEARLRDLNFRVCLTWENMCTFQCIFAQPRRWWVDQAR